MPITFKAGLCTQLCDRVIIHVLPLKMIGSSRSIPIVIIPIVSCGTNVTLFNGIAVSLKNIVSHHRVVNRTDHLHQISIRQICPACIVIYKHPAVRVPVPLDAPTCEVREG